MKAKENTQYAVIMNNEVAQIFSGNDIKEWDSNTIHAVEIPQNLEVFIGTKFNPLTNEFIETTLDESKRQLLLKINFYFEREIHYMRGDASQSEIDTWNDQLREAKSLKAGSNEAVPLLTQIAKNRNIDIHTLADKIIEKNTAYLDKVGQLVGCRQSLEKRIENANSKEELDAIEYKSPFLSE